MKIFIIGAEGFIGSHLTQYFISKSYQVVGCGRQLISTNAYKYYQVTNPEFKWEHIFSEYSFDYCINAAGNGNVNYSLTNPLEDFRSNTLLTITVLDQIRRSNIQCRYLHLSSAAVYGNPVSLPIKENDPCKPISPYGWHKLMAEDICREYNSLYNLNVAIVRPFSIYGEGLKKQLFWDLFQKYKSDPTHIELWGTGKESRDFIHIDDVTRALDIILQQSNMKAEVYNLASGTEVTIKEVVDLLFQELAPELDVTFNNLTRKGDPLNWRADISKIKNLGFETNTNLESGIKKLSAWLLNKS